MSVSNCSSGNCGRERDIIIRNSQQMNSSTRSGFGGPREIRGTNGDDVIIGGKKATINGQPVVNTRGGQPTYSYVMVNGRPVALTPQQLASSIFRQGSDSFKRTQQQYSSRPQHFSTNRSRPFQGPIAYTAPPAPTQTSSERSSSCPPRTSNGCKGGICSSDLNVGETLDANGNRVPPKSSDEGDVIIG